MNNFQPSSFWQRDGSFLSFVIWRSVIPYLKSFRQSSIKQSEIVSQWHQFVSIDHMDGFTDPETLTGYPATRVVSIGLNIEL